MARDGVAYKRFADMVDGPLLVLAILWLPVLVIPLITKPSPTLAASLDAIDYLVWAIFVIEYLVKFYLAPDRRHFVKTHLIDLIVILIPFLRPLRMARILRVLKLARVATVLTEVLRRARSILTHKGLHFVVLAAVLIVFAAAGLELYFESGQRGSNIHNFGDAIWWAVVTVTTVGYGDKYPVTAGGRGVAAMLMLVGIGLVGTVTATVASYFIEQQQDNNTAEIDQRLDRIERMLESLMTASGSVSTNGSNGLRVALRADGSSDLNALAAANGSLAGHSSTDPPIPRDPLDPVAVEPVAELQP